jgi:GT2 family glycosyltransferase
MDPLVSIIVPAYNAEKYIGNTIDSVLSQTYPHFELLIINDGSTDRTRKIVEFYCAKDARVKLTNIQNQGVSAARNFGLNNSAGQYICVLDADDLWSSNKLHLQIQEITKDDSKIILGGIKRFTQDSMERISWGEETHLPRLDPNTRYLEQILSLSQYEMVLFNTLLAKREILLKEGGWDSSLKNAEDWDFWCRLARSYEFIHLPNVLMLYRKHPTSATKQSSVGVSLSSQLKVITKAYDAGMINKRKRNLFSSARYSEAIRSENYVGNVRSSSSLLFDALRHSSLPSSREFYILIADLIRNVFKKVHK